VRIVQIANFYTPTSGGLRTTVDEIGRGYLAAGHERILIVPGPADSDEETPAGRRICLRSPRLAGSGSYHVLTARRRTAALLDALRPDLVEASDKLSIGWIARWTRARRVPLVLFSHERIDAILRTRVPSWFPLGASADLVNRRLARLAGLIVVTSGFAAAEFTRVGVENLRRVPLGVDLETFKPVPGVPASRLITVSRLSREKHPERAVEAVRVLRDRGVPVELTIVGDGPLRPEVTAAAAGLPVRFAGHVADRAAVARLVAEADVAVLPSPAETFGLAILEALACGTPVVVPDDGAARELVGGPGSGVVSDGTPRGLADGVVSLLATPVELRRSAARASAERFPWSATVSGLLEVYAALVAASEAGTPAVLDLSRPAGLGMS